MFLLMVQSCVYAIRNFLPCCRANDWQFNPSVMCGKCIGGTLCLIGFHEMTSNVSTN